MKLGRGMFILALLLSLPLAAAERSAPPEGKRFLFIIDTSLPMARQAKSMPEEVMKLLESGLQGRLSEGDTIGMWTYAEELQTGKMPLQQWRRDQARVILARISDFLATRRHAGFAEFTAVTGRLLSVAKESADLTIFLVSDGGHSVHGTPYDDVINANFRAHGAEMRKLGVPFITALVVRNGEFAGCAVNSPFQPLRIPNLPPPVVQTPSPSPVAPSVVAAPQKQPATRPVTKKVAPAEVAPTSPSTATPTATRTVKIPVPGGPPQNQLQIVEKWPATNTAPVTTSTTTPASAPTAAPKPDRALEISDAPPATAEVTAHPPAVTARASIAAGGQGKKTTGIAAPATSTVAVPESPSTRRVQARTIDSGTQADPDSVQTAVKPADVSPNVALIEPSPFTVTGLLIAIIALLVLVIALMLVLWRRSQRPPQASLITTYMERDQMR